METEITTQMNQRKKNKDKRIKKGKLIHEHELMKMEKYKGTKE